MKTTLFFILFLLGFSSIYAQKVRFTYDFAGNQTKREFTLFSARPGMEEEKRIEDIVDGDMVEFFPNDIISYYPNPVREELFIKWELRDGEKISTIILYNINGQQLAILSDIEDKNSRAVSFYDYPVGTYFITLNYNNGKQESIKIIKK